MNGEETILEDLLREQNTTLTLRLALGDRTLQQTKN